MNRTFLVVAVLAALASPLPVQAGELDALVRGWYRAHQDEERAPAALRLVRPHVSKRLAALIDREERCKARTRELCNLEFNVIVNGQDWELKRVHVEAAKVSDARASVTARFINIERRRRSSTPSCKRRDDGSSTTSNRAPTSAGPSRVC